MKKFLALMVMVALLAGCTTKTQYGECIGINDDKKPNLQYKADTWNIIMAVIFSETVVVPLVVIFSDLYCPIDEIKPIEKPKEPEKDKEKTAEVAPPSEIKEDKAIK